MSVPYHIRRGDVNDAAPLAEFAARTFRETFAAANRPEDMAQYLPRAYGTQHQSQELADPAITTLIMEDGTSMIAYAMLRSGPVPSCVGDANAIELWRFYLDKAWHGRGLAQQLMAAVHNAAVERGARTLWLGVWEKNPRAIAFYEKNGFRDVGAHDFWVGSDRQTDRIMIATVQ